MAGLDKPRVVLLGGPTACGKTALSVELARCLDAEIISADSMQVYQGLTIGTAQVTPEEMRGVPHHLVNFLDPQTPYSAADFVEQADACIRKIHARGRLAIVVGGTGLYLSSLLDGRQYSLAPENEELRRSLCARLETEGEQALYQELLRRDPQTAGEVHPHNHKRLLRALELSISTGQTRAQRNAASIPLERPYHSIVFCLSDPDRTRLYERIDRRVDAMLQKGLLREARQVWENRLRYPTASQAIGYKEYFPFFEGTDTIESCTEQLKRVSRRYAKRQLTWFRHVEGVRWLDASDPSVCDRAQAQIRSWLLEQDAATGPEKGESKEL